MKPTYKITTRRHDKAGRDEPPLITGGFARWYKIAGLWHLYEMYGFKLDPNGVGVILTGDERYFIDGNESQEFSPGYLSATCEAERPVDGTE